MVGVIDEIQKDGPRPIKVEDLRGLISEEFVGGVFEIVLIDRMEPVPERIVAGSVVRLGDLLPDGRLTNGSTGDDRPDVAGIEGLSGQRYV